MRLAKVHVCHESGKRYPRAYWQEGGIQRREYLPTMDKALIKAWVAKKERELAVKLLGLVDLEQKPTAISLQEAVATYFKEEMVAPPKRVNTVRDRRWRLSKLQAMLGADTRLDAITRDVLLSLRSRRLESASGTTVHHDLIALYSLLNWAREKGWLREVPKIALPTPRTHRGAIVPEKHVQKILAGLDLAESSHRALWFALHMGMRPADIERMTGEDWVREKAYYRLGETSKTGQPLYFPLPWDSWDEIKDYIPVRGPVCPRVLATDGMKRITSALCGTGYGLRIMRPTWATAMAEAGVPGQIIGQLMAHASKSITDGYILRDVESLRSETAKLPWKVSPGYPRL